MDDAIVIIVMVLYIIIFMPLIVEYFKDRRTK